MAAQVIICHGQPQERRESERRCNLISSHLVSLFQTKYPNNLTHLTFDAVVPRHLKGLYRSYAPDFFSTNIFSSGSLKERAVYKRAGHQTSDATNEQAQPQNLKLSIRPITPIFGTDFDVIVEVRVQNKGMHAENQHFYFHHNFIFDFIFLAGKCRVRHKRDDHILFHLQVRNDGGRDAYAQLTVLILAVTYNSLHRGECQRQTLSVTVPAHSGQTSSHDTERTTEGDKPVFCFVFFVVV